MSKRNVIKIYWAVTMIFSFTQLAICQTKSSSPNDSMDVRAGTKISAQLESAVDAKTAKPGDEVSARVTKNVKQNGKVVVHKGDRLIGRVTNAQAATNAHEGSRLGVAFDRLASAGSTAQFNTVVSALFSSSNEGNAQAADLPMMGSGPMPMGGGGGRSGGLLGGTTNTVSSTVGAAGSTLGNVSGNVGGATQLTLSGVTSAGIATPTKMIHIDSSTQAQNQTGLTSALSTRQGNLHIDSGTRMEFRVSTQGSAQVN